MNEVGGFRKDLNIALTGLDIEAKAQLVEEAFWLACPYGPDDFDSVTTKVIRSIRPTPGTNEEAVALWHITLKDRDERQGRSRGGERRRLTVPSRPSPGLLQRGVQRRRADPAFGVYRPALRTGRTLPGSVHHAGRAPRTVVDSTAPKGEEQTSRPKIGPPRTTPRRRATTASARHNFLAPARATRVATPTSASSPVAMKRGRGSTVS